MGKQYQAMVPSVWTTGAGIVIGTDIDLGGVLMGAAASTITVKVGTDTVFSISGGSIIFAVPLATNGAITGTSSGGSFSVLYRNRR